MQDTCYGSWWLSHKQLGPSEDHRDPLELGRGSVWKQEWSEADPAGPAISSLPSLYQSLGVFAILQNQRGSVGNWRITSQSP